MEEIGYKSFRDEITKEANKYSSCPKKHEVLRVVADMIED